MTALVRTSLVLLLATALAGIATRPTRAQEPSTVARWQAWIGCWTPATAQSPTAASVRAADVVCLVPAQEGPAVDRVTIRGGQIRSRERLDATGASREREKDGCTGRESAQWSRDTRRVFLQSDDECAGGLKRRISGLMALSRDGDWLDISAVTIGANTVVRILRYRPSDERATLPAEIAAALQANAASADAARIAGGSPVQRADIVEAVRQLDAGVVEAWLAELGQRFAVDAKGLVELANAGVPGRVIDMMVALAYPRAFAIKPSVDDPGLLASRLPGTSQSGGSTYFPPSVWDCDRFFDDISRSWSTRDLCLATYYARYGYSPYIHGLAYGNWYLGNQPFVVVAGSNGSGGGGGGAATAPSDAHGQVVKGRGYSQGATGDQQGTATSRGASPQAPVSFDHSPSSPSGVSSSGSSDASTSSSSSSSGSSGASSGGGERTAHPK